MKKIGMLVSAIALCASGAAMAQQGFYVGGGVGQSMTSFNGTDFSANAANNETLTLEKNKTAYKIFGGYNVNQYFGVEGGFVDFGKPAAKFSGNAGTDKVSEELSSWFVAAKGTLPLTEQFNLFGKLGVTQNKAKVSSSAGGTSASDSRSGVLYGVGAEYNVTKQVGLRVEYEDFGNFGKAFDFNSNTGTGRTKASMWSVGATFKF